MSTFFDVVTVTCFIGLVLAFFQFTNRETRTLIHFILAGVVLAVANQAGNANWGAATQVQQSFLITSALLATPGSSRVSLNWKVYTGETTGYQIYKSTDNLNFTLVTTAPAVLAPGAGT